MGNLASRSMARAEDVARSVTRGRFCSQNLKCNVLRTHTQFDDMQVLFACELERDAAHVLCAKHFLRKRYEFVGIFVKRKPLVKEFHRNFAQSFLGLSSDRIRSTSI